MNAQDIRHIAETMRTWGITHLKTNEIEMSCPTLTPASSAPETVEKAQPLPPAPPPSEPEQQASKEGEDIIKHRIEAMTSLMKLDDVQLVDALFPEPKEPEAE